MSKQIVISAQQMTLAGFTRQQVVVAKGYMCPDCGGSNPDCDYCGGRGHGLDTVRTMFVRGEDRLGSYSDDSFIADCSHWGSNRALFESLGLLALKHRMV